MSTAVVLAGGRSSRMPFDKQTIKINGKLAAVNLADRLAPLFDRIIIISNRPELYGEDCPYRVLPDCTESHGPISGFYTGLCAARRDREDDCGFVYFIACDMPFIEEKYIGHMRTLMDRDCDVIAAMNGDHIETFNAFYSKDLVEFLEELLQKKQYSLLRIYDMKKIYYVPEEEICRYDKDKRMFMNINCMEDYERYLADV